MKHLESILTRLVFLLIIIYFSLGFIILSSLAAKGKDSHELQKKIDISDLKSHPNIKSQSPQKSFKIIDVLPTTEPQKIFKIQVNQANLQFPILMFHHIRDYYNLSDSLGMGLSISPSFFEEILKKIIAQKYSVITFYDLLEFYFENKALPNKPIMLTFDDGYDDVFANAIPLLQKYSMKGSFSIITGLTGKPGYLNWEQIKQMKNLGEEITSHTVTQPSLAAVSDSDLKKELFDSKSTLDKQLNQFTQVLIYPSGRYDQKIMDEAKLAGYVMARTTESTYKLDGTKLFQLPAIRVTHYGMGF
jgi:peptidoglycan/xylan/chitin deacetylase (PgdA/CDA1 family)